MGKYNLGILGYFSGKIGTVVGASWRGIRYMRSLAAKRGNANASDKQLEQQARFALITGFLKPVKPLLEIGFKNYANGRTGYNSAHSYNLKNALQGNMDNLQVDYGMVMVSRGDLPAVNDLQATSTVPATLELSWADNTGRGRAKATDQLLLAVFCPTLGDATYSVDEAVRGDEGLTLQLQADFGGETVQVYVGWLSADGKEVANSKYAGAVVLQ